MNQRFPWMEILPSELIKCGVINKIECYNQCCCPDHFLLFYLFSYAVMYLRRSSVTQILKHLCLPQLRTRYETRLSLVKDYEQGEHNQYTVIVEVH